MATNVVMPQMGESIAEGTIVRWIKKVGETVDRDEPLFEISTDKVDAEIPSPGAGVLTEIKVKEGETVPVNSVVAVIGEAGREACGVIASRRVSGARSDQPESRAPAAGDRPPRDGASAAAAHEATSAAPTSRSARTTCAARSRRRSCAGSRREHNVDIQQINGTGHQRPRDQERHPRVHPVRQDGSASARRRHAAAHASAGSRPIRPGEHVEIVPMTIMRRKIAEHMVLSAHTSPHVYSVYEVNFGRLAQLRDKKKGEYERAGAQADLHRAHRARSSSTRCARFPIVNASIDGDNIVYKKDINLGIAVALEQGLIVPVIRNADEKNLLGLSRAIEDLAGARAVEEAEPRRSAGWNVHDHQSRRLRRRLRPAADQPAAGGDPRRRRHRETRGRDRRRDRASVRRVICRSATTTG